MTNDKSTPLIRFRTGRAANFIATADSSPPRSGGDESGDPSPSLPGSGLPR